MKDNQLIFIVSQPRSGSTLLQALISNSSQIQTVSEPWILLSNITSLRPDLISAKFNNELTNDAFNDFLQKTKGFNKFHNSLTNHLLNIYSLIGGNNYVLDKTPRYYEILNEIVTLFPNAKIIILKRNPIDVLNSIIKAWIKNGIDDLFHFKRDILEAPKILNQFVTKEKYNPNIKVVKYEDLIINAEFILNDIFFWLGINERVKTNYEQNIQFKGLMGDQYGINQNKELIKKRLVDNNKHSIYWEEFKKGYVNYFLMMNLELYNDYKFNIKPKKTLLFNTFLYAIVKNLDTKKVSLKHWLIYNLAKRLKLPILK